MVDIAKLGVAVDTAQVESASGDLNQFAASAKNAETAATSLGNRTAAAAPKIAATGNAAQRASAQINMVGGSTANLAAQFNDIGIMLAAGQNPLMLALQQGTQVNQVFAQMDQSTSRVRALGSALMSVISPANLVTIGLIAGGAALGQWAIGALGARTETQSLDDTIQSLQDSTDAFRRATDSTNISISDSIRLYGEAASAARGLLGAQVDVARFEAARDLQNAVSALTDSFGDLGAVSDEAFSRIANKGQFISEAYAQLQDAIASGDTARQAALQEEIIALGQLPALVNDVAREYSITTEQAQDLLVAVREFQDAGTFSEQAAAANALAQEIFLASGGLNGMSEETYALYTALVAAGTEAATLESVVREGEAAAIDLSNAANGISFGIAISDSAAVVDNLRLAAAYAAQLSEQQGTGPAPRLGFGLPGTGVTTSEPLGFGRLPGPDRPATNLGTPTRSGGGGRSRSGGSGGGISDEAREAQRLQNEMTREAQRIYDRTRTALENYNAEVADLTELHEMGYLNADTFSRAMADLNAEFQRTEFAGIISEIDAFSDSFGQMIGQAENLGDVFRGLGDIFADTLARMASDWASRGMNDLLTAFVFGAGGGLTGAGSILSGIFGGFRAEGGPVSSGKGYIVGENGPEWFSPSTSGMITPNHALGGATSVEVRVSVDNNGNLQAYVAGVAGQAEQRAVQRVSRNMANDPYFGRPT